MTGITEYRKWLTDPYFDANTREELQLLEGKTAEIQDRFYKSLEFGTGGLRGIIGAGTNRMNIYTVRKATQGLANYICRQGGEHKGVAIAYDSRHYSAEFAQEAASVLNANGIETYRFSSLRPTPELSFAVRKLGCIAGIVITASHNPAVYNGYKVYWEDGGQITPPHDRNIMHEISLVHDFHDVKLMPIKDAVSAGLYHEIGTEIDEAYLDCIKRLSIHPDVIREQADHIHIVYSPFHGAGNLPVRKLLSDLGFSHVSVVKEQELPDGDFTTVPYPNPENPEAWKLAIQQAEREQADLIMVTDPDSDRLGLCARDSKTGRYVQFNGNMSGILIAEYILRERSRLNTLPAHPALVETIVTTKMAVPVAREYHADLIEVLTGFKYIGEKIREFEKTGSNHFVFGMEESYGCLSGMYARDKDACAAVAMLAEMAAFYQSRGMTLVDAMESLYQKYGYYKEGLATVSLEGEEGTQQILRIMKSLRKRIPICLYGHRVQAVRDYQAGIRKDLSVGTESKLNLPPADVLYFEIEGNAWCCVRPSGTEPKIKFYYGVCGTSTEDAQQQLDLLRDDIMSIALKSK